MNRSLRLSLFAAAVVAQLAIPELMIRHWETVLREGETFRFRVEPVDPYDAFRGRYVALRIESNRVPTIDGVGLERGTKLYAEIAIGSNGFARLAKGSLKRPEGKPYLNARVWYHAYDGIWLDLPIDRYYMNEKMAPRAEEAAWQHSKRTNLTASILVRVKDGDAVIQDLMIDGTPIRQYLMENQDKK